MGSKLMTLSDETRDLFLKEDIPYSGFPYPEEYFAVLVYLNEEHKRLKMSGREAGGFTEETQKSRGRSIAIWTQLKGVPISFSHKHLLETLGVENDLGMLIKVAGKGVVREAEEKLRTLCKHAEYFDEKHDLNNACYLLADIDVFLKIRKNTKNLKYDDFDTETEDYFCNYCHRLRTIKPDFCKHHNSQSSGYNTLYKQINSAFKNLGNIKATNENKPKRLVAWARNHPASKKINAEIEILKNQYDLEEWSDDNIDIIFDCFNLLYKNDHSRHLAKSPSLRTTPNKWSSDRVIEIINEFLDTEYEVAIDPFYFLASVKRMTYFALISDAAKASPGLAKPRFNYSLEDSGRA
ncbi:hypothetical protein [Gilvimarinus xylanilyticus]|uniref:Uncharacterized protein n=1 Tax=Gilvimarinus xylanilyticus TaxID=2944139 RepID=A0A9X2HVK3_9GAMM|nr:hypothetical protein [Gilvimarinus xylanilyticus]MCP8898975.1 hypothetical protein [Gilvimarinus xylanilyticus]